MSSCLVCKHTTLLESSASGLESMTASLSIQRLTKNSFDDMNKIISNLGRILEKYRRINKIVDDDDDDWYYSEACGYGTPNIAPSGPGCGYGYTWEDVESC